MCRAAQAPALRRQLAGTTIYLVGMMGCGKSSVGRCLARALGYRCVDADQVLEQAAGCTIPQLFASEGEEGFRRLETQVLRQIGQWHSCVVCTGGGVVTRTGNWGVMRQGAVVWLAAPAELLLQRLRADPTPRPLLATGDVNRRLRSLLEQREPLYAQADLRIDQTANQSPEDVARAVLRALPTILKTPPATEATETGITSRN